MKVMFENHTYELKEDAYITGSGRGHYEASAVDEEGKDCTVVWKILENYDGWYNGEDDACDWDNPYDIYYCEPKEDYDEEIERQYIKDNKVTFENHTYELEQNPILLEDRVFRAPAVDEEGKRCVVFWGMRECYNSYNYREEDACDWENPFDVLYD